MRVDVWSDVICPFCYVGEKRLENVARERGVEIEWVWHSFELEPDAPSTHSTPNLEMIAGKYRTNEAGAIQHQRNVAELCASEGIDFQWQKVKPGNTRLAHRIIQVAQAKGLGIKAAEVLFEAYMNEGEAIGERSVIERIAARIGLSHEEINAALSSNVIDDQIAADQQTAMEIGVTGVPFFVIDGKVALSGAQPRQVFDQALDRILLSKIERVEDDQALICDVDGCRIPDT
ncbi:DsbA family oxidoreductase [Rhizobium panacihumi]|uniref:DsbA family oxidoreductase n=1 Tax=Rhizobium panacihumi TaxID=2008450 RepID=UPI003D7C08BB